MEFVVRAHADDFLAQFAIRPHGFIPSQAPDGGTSLTACFFVVAGRQLYCDFHELSRSAVVLPVCDSDCVIAFRHFTNAHRKKV